MSVWFEEWLKFFSDHKDGFSVISTFAGLFGGAFALGLLLWRTRATAQQARTAMNTAETALNRHVSQTEADRERRITDAFAKATEQLENEKLSARLGAIYTLGRIANESQVDYWPTTETLAAFVAERRPIADEAQKALERQEDILRPPADIRAALHVIGRRSKKNINTLESWDKRIDLSYLDLRRCILRDCDLTRLNFSYADFTRARFFSCIFNDTLLFETQLENTTFGDATVFQNCFLSDAILVNASLYGAIFESTDLTGVSLSDAFVVGADFQKSVGLVQQQIEGACGDHTTKLPLGLTIPNHWPDSLAETEWQLRIKAKAA